MARPLDGPFDLAEIERFLETFMYHEDVLLVDEVVRMDAEQRSIEALLDTTRRLPVLYIYSADRHSQVDV